jgi:general secretion pathway protein I
MRRSGFTLLEVVVAMAMLALGLMAIFDLNSRAVSLHSYGKRLTVATLLARGKMIDLEQKLYDDGTPADDDEESGDFSDEGWPSFKWRARILVPKTQGVPPEKLISAVLGIPVGEDEENPLAALGLGGSGNAGPLAGLAQAQFTQMVDQISKSVREVHLTVYWQDGTQTETVDLATHVVSLGPGSDRNAQAAPGNQPPTQGGAGQCAQLVDSITCRPVPNALPISGGAGCINPQNNRPLVPAANCTPGRGS